MARKATTRLLSGSVSNQSYRGSTNVGPKMLGRTRTNVSTRSKAHSSLETQWPRIIHRRNAQNILKMHVQKATPLDPTDLTPNIGSQTTGSHHREKLRHGLALVAFAAANPVASDKHGKGK